MEEETPWLSFSDVVTALLFVFIATTFWFMFRLEQARQRTDAEFERWRGADREAGVLLTAVAQCLEGETSGLVVRPVVDVSSRTLSMYFEASNSTEKTIAEWFPNCSAQLNADADGVVSRVRSCLAKDLPPLTKTYGVQLTLEGHTDARNPNGVCAEIFPTNWELSGARAGAVLRRLLCEDGGCPDTAQQEAQVLSTLSEDQQKLQIIAAGRAASRPALHALCETHSSQIDAALDAAVCKQIADNDPKLLATIQGSLGSMLSNPLPSADAALVAWANDPRCVSQSPPENCRERLGRLRRVDLRVDLRPIVAP